MRNAVGFERAAPAFTAIFLQQPDLLFLSRSAGDQELCDTVVVVGPHVDSFRHRATVPSPLLKA